MSDTKRRLLLVLCLAGVAFLVASFWRVTEPDVEEPIEVWLKRITPYAMIYGPLLALILRGAFVLWKGKRAGSDESEGTPSSGNRPGS